MLTRWLTPQWRVSGSHLHQQVQPLIMHTIHHNALQADTYALSMLILPCCSSHERRATIVSTHSLSYSEVVLVAVIITDGLLAITLIGSLYDLKSSLNASLQQYDMLS
jgi:hypothetical protein